MAYQEYLTEDGKIVKEGDPVYNYYDMKLGVVGKSCGDGSFSGWFEFQPTDGSQKAILNGQRVCTVEYAIGRGFRGADGS